MQAFGAAQTSAVMLEGRGQGSADLTSSIRIPQACLYCIGVRLSALLLKGLHVFNC